MHSYRVTLYSTGFDGVDFLSLDTITIPNNLMNKHESSTLRDT